MMNKKRTRAINLALRLYRSIAKENNMPEIYETTKKLVQSKY